MPKAMTKKPVVQTLTVVEGDVLPKRDVDLYIQSTRKQRGDRGKPPLYENREELIAAIADYFDSLQAMDGNYINAPSLIGLGVFLGYASRSWHENTAYPDVVDHARSFIEAWRHSKAVVPRGGINPAAIMFLINRDDAREAITDETRDVTPDDDRPEDVTTMIDELWRESTDGKD